MLRIVCDVSRQGAWGTLVGGREGDVQCGGCPTRSLWCGGSECCAFWAGQCPLGCSPWGSGWAEGTCFSGSTVTSGDFGAAKPVGAHVSSPSMGNNG